MAIVQHCESTEVVSILSSIGITGISGAETLIRGSEIILKQYLQREARVACLCMRGLSPSKRC